MKIQKGNILNIAEYLMIYDSAISFMRNTGNLYQWTEDYRPNRESIMDKLNKESFYEIVDDNKIIAVFALIFGTDDTYKVIDGNWLNDDDYVTIHMVAKRDGYNGIFKMIANFAKARAKNVRIDTHHDNKIMQRAILNNGFKYCGIIHINDKNHSPRMAYQFVKDDIPFNDFKLFIVDYDGTIISSMEMWRHTCSSFLISKGIELKEDIDSIVSPMTNKEAAEYVREKYFPNYTLDMIGKEMADYVKIMYVKQQLKPNAISLLKKINSIGKVVLYSATSMQLLKESIDNLGIKDYFQEIYSGSDCGWTKGDGTGFINLIEKERINKEEALIIEDSLRAIKGAKSQGFYVLGVEDTANLSKLANVYELSDYCLPLK